MKFCDNHQEQIFAAVKARGLWDFVAPTSQERFAKGLDALMREHTRENFDPVLLVELGIGKAFCACIEKIAGVPAPLVLFAFSEASKPRITCPICYLNAATERHDATCTDPNCAMEKGLRFESLITSAADAVAKEAPTLKGTAA